MSLCFYNKDELIDYMKLFYNLSEFEGESFTSIDMTKMKKIKDMEDELKN